MIAVIDTSVFAMNPTLDASEMRALLQASLLDDEIVVAFPEVVVLEAVGKVRDTATSALVAIESKVQALARIGAAVDISVDAICPDDIANSYERWLLDELKKHAVQILPMPDTAHRIIVERAVRRQQPFDREGRKGYRDVLIWESILALAEQVDRDDEIWLLSSNHVDFGHDRKPGKLADRLVDEVRDKGVSTVKLASLKEFVDTLIAPAAEVRDEIRARLDDEQTLHDQIVGEIVTAIGAQSHALDLSIFAEYVRQEGDQPSECTIEGLELEAERNGWSYVEVSSARKLDDVKTLVTFGAELDAYISYRSSPPEDEHEFASRWLSDSDSTTTTVWVDVEAEYTASTQTLENFTIRDIRPIGAGYQKSRRGRYILETRDKNAAWERDTLPLAINWARSIGYDEVLHAGGLQSEFKGPKGYLLVSLIGSNPPRTVEKRLRGEAKRLHNVAGLYGREATTAVLVTEVLPSPELIGELTQQAEIRLQFAAALGGTVVPMPPAL